MNLFGEENIKPKIFPFIHAEDALKEAESESIDEWSSFFTCLLSDEKELLEQAIEDQYMFDSLRSDDQKINAIDFAIEKRKEAHDKLQSYKSKLRELLTRLERTEDTYGCYFHWTRDKMDNKYYGKDILGNEVFLKK